MELLILNKYDSRVGDNSAYNKKHSGHFQGERITMSHQRLMSVYTTALAILTSRPIDWHS